MIFRESLFCFVYIGFVKQLCSLRWLIRPVSGREFHFALPRVLDAPLVDVAVLGDDVVFCFHGLFSLKMGKRGICRQFIGEEQSDSIRMSLLFTHQGICRAHWQGWEGIAACRSTASSRFSGDESAEFLCRFVLSIHVFTLDLHHV